MNIHIGIDSGGSKIMAASANRQGGIIQRFRQAPHKNLCTIDICI